MARPEDNTFHPIQSAFDCSLEHAHYRSNMYTIFHSCIYVCKMGKGTQGNKLYLKLP